MGVAIRTTNRKIGKSFGFLLLAAWSLILGGVTAIISPWIYVLFLSPVGEALGIIVGLIFILKYMDHSGLQSILLIVAVLASILTYGSYQLGKYLLIHAVWAAQVKQAAEQEWIKPSTMHVDVGIDVDAAIDHMLITQTGQSGFIGSLIEQANTGIAITTHNSKPVPIPITTDLKGGAVWLYWLAELAVIVGICAYKAPRLISQTPKRLCPNCGGRYVHESVGAVAPSLRDVFKMALERGDFARAGGLITSYDLGPLAYPRLNVDVEHCEGCHQSDAILRGELEQVVDTASKSTVKRNVLVDSYQMDPGGRVYYSPHEKVFQVRRTLLVERNLTSQEDQTLRGSIPTELPQHQ